MELYRYLLLTLFCLTTLTSCSQEDEDAFVFSSIPTKVFLFSTGQNASAVLGQTDYTSNLAGTSLERFNKPQGLDVDSTGSLRVSDSGNHRVMGFNSVPYVTATDADFLLGQNNFFSNSLLAPSASTFNTPLGGRSGAGKYILVDTNNHRVLIYNSLPRNYQQLADVVIGSASMTAPGAAGCNATDLNFPSYVSIVSGKLIISDSGNNRVLIYSSVPSVNMASPNLVIGQPNFTTCAATTTASGLSTPKGVWSDGSKFIVADEMNNRVLVWNSFPTSDGQAANLVLGQSDFVTNTANSGGLSASSLRGPVSVIVSPFGQTFISDRGNNRVLIWNSLPSVNKAAAENVLGQPAMTSASAPNPPSGTSMSSPGEILFTSNSLLVTDTENSRVLIFNTP